MPIPQCKLDLGGTEYTDVVNSAIVKLRENNFSTATLVLDNNKSRFYTSLVDTFTEAKLYFKDASEASWTQVFGGYVRELLPILGVQGSLLTLGCKGYGAALDETHCNRDYGFESANASLDTCKEIWDDLVTDFINKSFDDGALFHNLLNLDDS